MDFAIRLAAPDDAPTLAAFNAAMARETEHLELDAERLLRGVRAVLDDPAKGFYLVAEEGGTVIGQLMITYEWSDWRNGVFWWVQSVYVRPESRGRGVYTTLYREAVRRAQAAGDVCGLRLYVEKENSRAQAAYRKLGMDETVYLMYETDFVLQR
ncbi:MAG: GNAT family N-acetyltransferase [Acidobacteria bacterium]|nr:GNAT family N-acetyltransferase [Acidobacteriota bacterium]